MGRGRSGSRARVPRDRDTDHWREAWETWDANNSRWENKQAFIKDFAGDFEVTEEEERVVYKSFASDGFPQGYIKTSNSYRINQEFYNPANEGKSLEELFPRTLRDGTKTDIRTIRTLDKLIDQNKTKRNAVFTRYTDARALTDVFGFTSEQIQSLVDFSHNPAKLKELSDGFKGRSTYSKSYTSTSANREANVFKYKEFERRIYTPAGTKAFACKENPVESETIFGRGMKTSLMRITYEHGHIVLHEYMEGYDNKKLPK